MRPRKLHHLDPHWVMLAHLLEVEGIAWESGGEDD